MCPPFSDLSRQSPSLVSAHAWSLGTGAFWARSYTISYSESAKSCVSGWAGLSKRGILILDCFSILGSLIN